MKTEGGAKEEKEENGSPVEVRMGKEEENKGWNLKRRRGISKRTVKNWDEAGVTCREKEGQGEYTSERKRRKKRERRSKEEMCRKEKKGSKRCRYKGKKRVVDEKKVNMERNKR